VCRGLLCGKAGWAAWALPGCLFACFGAAVAHGATGFFGDGTGAAIFYVTDGSTSGEGTYRNVGNLNNFDYGDFIVLNGGSTTLMLRGGEGKTYKNGGGDVYGVNEYYRIYVDGATPGSYSSFGLPFNADLGGGDQRWKKTDQNVNLLSGLTQSGRYVVEYYWEQTGNQGTQYMNNGGSNYKTYFDLNYEINTSGTVTQNTAGGAATLSGNGSFVKKGSGTVQINANNSAFTGNAFIDQGTLEIQSGAFLTTGSITLGPEIGTSTGTLTISDSDGGTNVSNIIVVRASGAGSTIGATNTSGTNSYSGSIYLDGGATTSISSGGTLSFNGTEIDLKAQNLTVAGAGNTAISGTVRNSTGSGKILKQGTGTLTLSGNNTLSGNTEIDEGTLVVTGSMGTSHIYMGNGGAPFNNANAALTFNGSTASYANNITANPSGGTGTRTLSKEGSTGQTLNGTLTANNDLAIRVSGSGSLTLGGNVTAGTSGTKTISNTGTGTGELVLSGTLGNGAGTLGFTQNSSTSAMRFSVGSQTFSGDVLLQNGRIILGVDNALGAGQFKMEGGEIVSSNTNTRNISNNATLTGTVTMGAAATNTGLINFNGGGKTITLIGNSTINALSNVAISHNMTGAFSLTKNGSGILSMITTAKPFSGGFILNNGTVLVGDNGALGTGTITLNSGTLSASSATARALTNTLQIGGAVVFGDGTNAGTLTFSGPVTLTADSTITNPTTTTFTGAVGGGFGLAKDGNTLLTLAGNNTYTGTTTINAGTLQIGNGGGSGGLAGNIVNNGTLLIDRTGSSTLAGNISGTGGITKNGTSSLTLNGSNTYAGGVLLNAGTLNIGSATALGTGGNLTIGGANTVFDNTSGSAIISSSNRLVLTGGGTTFGGTSDLVLGGLFYGGAARTLTVSSGTLTVSFIDFADSGTNRNFTKAGAGTLVIQNAASASMDNTVSLTAGITILGNKSALGTNTVSLATGSLGASTDLSGADAIANAFILSSNSAIVGSQNLEIAGSLTNSGGNRTLSVSNTGLTTLSGPVYLSELSGTGRVLTINATNSVVLSGVVSDFNGTGTAGSLAKLGNGTLTLAGANTHSGGTTLTAGTLNLNNAAAPGTGTLTIAGGTLGNTSGANITLSNNNAQTWSGNFAFAGPNDLNLGTGAIALAAARTITVDSGNLTAGGVISGAGGITKNGTGTLVLTGNNTFTAGIRINGGVLEINTIANGGNASALGAAGTSASNLQLAGGTLRYTGATTSSDRNFTMYNATTVAIDVANAGSILTLSGTTPSSSVVSAAMEKLGEGTLALAGTMRITGGLAIQSGTVTAQATSAMGVSNNVVSFGSSGTGVLNLQLAAGTLNQGLNASTGNGTILLNPASSGAGVTHTMGPATFGGDRVLTVQGGANVASGTAQLTTGAVTLAGNATLRVLNPAAGTTVLSMAGTAGTGNLTLSNDGTASGGITVTASANHTGLIINSGAGSGGATITGGIGTNLAGITQASATSNITVSSSAMNMNPSGTTLRNTGAGGLLTVSGGIAGTGNLTLANDNTTANGITVSTISANHTGWISNTGTGSGGVLISSVVGTNVAGVVQNSATSSLTLSGSNTYTGATVVSSGGLILAPTGSISPLSPVFVSGGARFGSNNTASPVANPLVLNPGSSLFGTGSFAPAGVTIEMDLSGGEPLFSSISTGTAAFTKGGALEFSILNPVPGSYAIFSGSSVAGSFSSVAVGGVPLGSLGGGNFAGTAGAFDYAFNNSTNVLAVVPEPSAVFLLALAGLLALGARLLPVRGSASGNPRFFALLPSRRTTAAAQPPEGSFPR